MLGAQGPPPQHGLYPVQLPYLASCVQRAFTLHRLLYRMRSEIKAQLPCYAYFVGTQSQVSNNSS